MGGITTGPSKYENILRMEDPFYYVLLQLVLKEDDDYGLQIFFEGDRIVDSRSRYEYEEF